jgi:transcriptional regulator with XRE-family HTH domain
MDDVWAAEIGERIKTARQAAKMSRADVGEALGRTEAAVAAYEQGKRAPFKEVREIARLINADLAVLLHGGSYQDSLGRIEAKLDRLLAASKPETLGTAFSDDEARKDRADDAARLRQPALKAAPADQTRH